MRNFWHFFVQSHLNIHYEWKPSSAKKNGVKISDSAIPNDTDSVFEVT